MNRMLLCSVSQLSARLAEEERKAVVVLGRRGGRSADNGREVRARDKVAGGGAERARERLQVRGERGGRDFSRFDKKGAFPFP